MININHDLNHRETAPNENVQRVFHVGTRTAIVGSFDSYQLGQAGKLTLQSCTSQIRDTLHP